jgi:four helix bundle protein
MAVNRIGDKKIYNLDERTLRFAKDVMDFVGILLRTLPNTEVIKQLVRSAGSIGANYIEASESLGKKDFGMRIKICRKEAKETIYWLKLLQVKGNTAEKRREILINEAVELMRIFGAIVSRTTSQNPDVRV